MWAEITSGFSRVTLEYNTDDNFCKILLPWWKYKSKYQLQKNLQITESNSPVKMK
jgi:hypothetical protein